MPDGRAVSPCPEDRDGPRDECGVFGIYAPGHEVSRLSYFALYALQHRGQESAGIAAADRGGNIMTRRELGLVSQVFTENDLRTLQGELAIGHVRYSTTGSNAWENSQPVQRSEGTNGSRREVALAHNGNLINVVELHADLSEQGVTFSSTSDSEIVAAMIATHPAEQIEDAIGWGHETDPVTILRGIDALRIFSTVLVLTGAEGVPVLSTYSYSLWDDAQKPHEAMAASMILALMVTMIGIGGLFLARRFSRDDGALA